MEGKKLNLRGASPRQDVQFIDSTAMTSILQVGAWALWSVNAYRDWGKTSMKDAIIFAGGVSNLYATYKLLQR